MQTLDLTEQYAELIRPLIPLAKRAYGSAAVDSPQREASDKYNRLLLEYRGRGGNITSLARELGIPDVTLRRRIRVARSGVVLGEHTLVARGRGRRDDTLIEETVKLLEEAGNDRNRRRAVIQQAHELNLSLYALATRLGVSYYSLYATLRSPMQEPRVNSDDPGFDVEATYTNYARSLERQAQV